MKSTKNKFLCPNCFELQDNDNIGYICFNTTSNCQQAIDKVVQRPNNKKLVCTECERSLMTKACPKCNSVLPFNIDTTKVYPLSIIGAKGSGKSSYLTVLIEQIRDEIGSAFDCALMASDDKTLSQYRSKFYEPIYRERICIPHSDSNEVEALSYSLIFGKNSGSTKNITDAISVTFFDTTGDNFASSTSMETFNRYLCFSAGIILLLDPLQFPIIRGKLQGKIRLPEETENADAVAILNRTISMVKTVLNLKESNEKIEIPLAVTISKIDAIAELLEPASYLRNDSTHLRQGYFDKVDFTASSDEIVSLLETWLGSEFYQLVSTNFENVAFFGLSTLGSAPDENNQLVKFYPFRVTDPFLWLLAQQGIIPIR